MLDLQLVLDVGCLISPLLEPVSGFVGFAVSSGEFFCPVWLWITAHSFLGDVGFCTILDCFGEGDCSIFGVIYWVGVFPSCEVFPWVSTILAPVSVFEIPTLLNNIDLGVLDVYWKVIRWQVDSAVNRPYWRIVTNYPSLQGDIRRRWVACFVSGEWAIIDNNKVV